jgi:hypothetical protein
LWIGVPQLMKAPVPSVTTYTAVIVASACALTFIAAAAQHALFGLAGF